MLSNPVVRACLSLTVFVGWFLCFNIGLSYAGSLVSTPADLAVLAGCGLYTVLAISIVAIICFLTKQYQKCIRQHQQKEMDQ